MNEAGLFGELLLGEAALLAEPRETLADGFSAEIDGRRARYSPLCNDGFGNLTTVNVTKGTAPSLSVSYNAATNRRTTDSADANGNILQSGVTNYDVENRITAANITNGTARYSYAPGNKRIWRGTWVNSAQTVDELTYYSASGAKLCAYNLTVNGYGQLTATSSGYYEYFGGKMIKNAGGYVNADARGSIGKYFPYGQERPSATANGKEKFATYFRDSETGLDYAQNRYHSSGDGRFLTPDPLGRSAKPADPGSWNRYAYVGGDPVNRGDPSGLIFTCYWVMGELETCEDDGWYYDQSGHLVPPATTNPSSMWSGSLYRCDYQPELCRSPQTQQVSVEDEIAGMLPDILSGLHTALDIAGFVPGAGELADLANALIYLAEGDAGDAAVSLAAMLPIGGQMATGARALRKNMIGLLGDSAAQGKHAHHWLPQEFRSLFEQRGINIDDAGLGTFIDPKDHGQLHKALQYNMKWKDWMRSNGGKFTPEEAFAFAEQLRKDLGF